MTHCAAKSLNPNHRVIGKARTEGCIRSANSRRSGQLAFWFHFHIFNCSFLNAATTRIFEPVPLPASGGVAPIGTDWAALSDTARAHLCNERQGSRRWCSPSRKVFPNPSPTDLCSPEDSKMFSRPNNALSSHAALAPLAASSREAFKPAVQLRSGGLCRPSSNPVYMRKKQDREKSKLNSSRPHITSVSNEEEHNRFSPCSRSRVLTPSRFSTRRTFGQPVQGASDRTPGGLLHQIVRRMRSSAR